MTQAKDLRAGDTVLVRGRVLTLVKVSVPPPVHTMAQRKVWAWADDGTLVGFDLEDEVTR